MSKTDKDKPYAVRKAQGERILSTKEPTESNFRKGRKALKREGNKRFRRSFRQPRYSRVAFYDYKTLRTEVFFL